MYVACSTLCFSKEPLESALRRIAEFEFDRIDLAVHETGAHLKPSQVAEHLDSALMRLRTGPGLTPSALDLDFGPVDPKTLRRRFEAMCRFAKGLTVAVLAMPAAPLGTPFDAEVRRLGELTEVAVREGLVLTVPTDSTTLTADPAQALALCRAVPGLGLTLDPSHYLIGPHAGADYDDLFPYVQNVHLRDTSRKTAEFQVRVGQGEIEYGRIVNLLARHGYDRALTVSILDGLDSPLDVELEVRKLKLLLESQI